MHDPWQTLRQVLEAYREILGGALCGFYVHGSLAFGCFSWEKSDLDFLVAVREPPAQAQKEALIRVLLHTQAPEKGFEMSVVLAGDCAAGRCPCRIACIIPMRIGRRFRPILPEPAPGCREPTRI